MTARPHYNKSEQTNSPALIANNPALLANPASAAEFGKPITPIANPFGAVGSPTANSPLFQGNIRARYEWAFSEYNMFAQVGATYSASSFTQTGNNPSLSTGGAVNTTLLRFENPPYGLVDASVGRGQGASGPCRCSARTWRTATSACSPRPAQFVVAQTPTRPRVLGRDGRLQVLRSRSRTPRWRSGRRATAVHSTGGHAEPAPFVHRCQPLPSRQRRRSRAKSSASAALMEGRQFATALWRPRPGPGAAGAGEPRRPVHDRGLPAVT